MLKPILKDFEQNLTSMGDECNCLVVWTFFSSALLGKGNSTGMKIDLVQSCGHCWVFQICWHSECNTLIASSFRILDSSTGIPSPLQSTQIPSNERKHEKCWKGQVKCRRICMKLMRGGGVKLNWSHLIVKIFIRKWDYYLWKGRESIKYWQWNCTAISEVAQSCLTLCDPMDCSLPDSSVHGIFQARVLEWVAISFSRKSSRPRDRTQVSRIVSRRFTVWATREVSVSNIYSLEAWT